MTFIDDYVHEEYDDYLRLSEKFRDSFSNVTMLDIMRYCEILARNNYHTLGFARDELALTENAVSNLLSKDPVSQFDVYETIRLLAGHSKKIRSLAFPKLTAMKSVPIKYFVTILSDAMDDKEAYGYYWNCLKDNPSIIDQLEEEGFSSDGRIVQE